MTDRRDFDYEHGFCVLSITVVSCGIPTSAVVFYISVLPNYIYIYKTYLNLYKIIKIHIYIRLHQLCISTAQHVTYGII